MKVFFDYVLSLVSAAIIVFVSFMVKHYCGDFFGILTMLLGTAVMATLLTKKIERE